MVNVGVKASDIGFQAAESSRPVASGVKTAQSDRFKKLLQGKQDTLQESSDTKEVTKDTAQDKTEAADQTGKPDQTEEGKVSDKDAKEDQAGEEVGTDDSQARGLLAAYQMDQGFRPELLTAEPEVVIEMPEVVEALPEGEAAELAGELIAGAAAEQAEVQTAAETAVPVEFQTEARPQETVQVKEPEVQAAAPEAAETVSVRKQDVRTENPEENSQAQTNEDYQAQQTAAAPVAQAPVRDMGEEIQPQEVTTVHVAQPEELPEKLTDQIMGKMAEGVQSFEIEIEPENLGKISVKILYEDGQATVSIFCTEKKALDVLGNHAREIGGIIDRNLGGETKIYVEKQEPDYLNQNRDENQKGRQEEQEQQKENGKQQEAEDAEQFLQKLRLGLMG